MNFSDLSEISAAAVGALLLWGFQLFDKIRDRRHMRESTLVAIASEVKAICDLIRAQKYLDEFSVKASSIRRGDWDGTSYIIDIRGNYFKAFDALVSSLSHLPPEQVTKIVSFYAYCQSAIDSTRPDGPNAKTDDLGEKATVVIGMEKLLTAILVLGDEIVQLPKNPLVGI